MIDAVGSITIKVIGDTPSQEIPWLIIAVVGGVIIVSGLFLMKK